MYEKTIINCVLWCQTCFKAIEWIGIKTGKIPTIFYDITKVYINIESIRKNVMDQNNIIMDY